AGKKADLATIARDLKLSAVQLAVDFSLLRSRGYLQKDGDSFAFTSLAQTQDLIKYTPRKFNGPSDLVPCFRNVLSGKASDSDHHTALSFLAVLPAPQSYVGWPAGPYQMEIGFRVVPLVLALRSLGLTAKLKSGAKV